MRVIIHKTAEVAPEARIGDNTTIWHNCQIGKDAFIGRDCVIGHNCFVASGAKLGDGVKIQSNTDIWQGVELCDFVFVGPSAVFTNDLNPRAKYPKKDFPQYGQWKPTLVKEGATIGANATIVCGTTIGKWAFIGAGAVVTEDIPDHALVVGVPARILGWVCECNNRLNFENGEAECKICGKKYQTNDQQIKRIK